MASSCCRPSISRTARARVEPFLVAVLADPDLLDVLLEPADVAVEVVDRDLGADPLVLERGELPGHGVDLGELGQRLAPVRELGQGGVHRLQFEQAALGFRGGLHGRVSFDDGELKA